MSTLKSSAEHLTLNADGSGNDIKFQSNATEVAAIDQAGNLTLSGTVDGVDIQTLNTTAGAALPKAGGTMTGDTLHGDNVKAKFGASDDLEIYHDGSNTRIHNNVGDLYLRNYSDNKQIFIQTDNGAGGHTNYVSVNGLTGAVELSHYGSEKLATTATGIDVTGSTAHTAGDITNSISGSYKLFGANGTAGSNSYVTYCFEGDNDTGMNRTGNNNLQLVTAGAAAIKIDGAGIVTKPYQPAFDAYHASGSYSSGTTSTSLDLNSTRLNRGNHYNTSTDRFVAPVAGVYQFNYRTIVNGAISNAHIRMTKNGVNLSGSDSHYSAVAGMGWNTWTMHLVVELSANDYVQVYHAANTTIYGNSYQSFNGYLLG